MVVHNKLVRDKIPRIISASGKTAITNILSDEEYLIELDRKLNEECAEYQKDKSIIEIWPTIRKALSYDEKRESNKICDAKIDKYFERQKSK